MCRTRQQVIQDEPDVQKLISLKGKLEDGEVNGFETGRLIFELTKLEVQIESTIREFLLMDKQTDFEDEMKILNVESRKGFENHYEFHSKNPSLIALFKKSPFGVLCLTGAFFTASSLFYVKESRDVMFSLVNLDALTGQSMLSIGFPLFLVLLITGVIAIIDSGKKKSSK